MIEYITAEQFSKQPEEVRKVLLDWWQPGERELVQGCYYGEFYDSEHIWNIGHIDMDYCKNELKPMPLFTEGQLRHFIEDKNGMYFISFKTDDFWTFSTKWGVIYTDQTDLLQAYWQVVCKIAKEG